MSRPVPPSTFRAVEPLDDKSRHLVAPPDPRTPRDIDEPPTIPDPVDLGSLFERPTVRTPAIDKAGLVRAPNAYDLRADAPTRPDDPAASDVFAPIRADGGARVLEAPTPIDRPGRAEAPTEIDSPARFAAAETRTLPMVVAREAEAREIERAEQVARSSRSQRERRLVETVLDTERKFISVADQDPRRAAHVLGIVERLRQSGVFGERDLALAMHAREKSLLAGAPLAEQGSREDRVFALGLLAREADDAYRARTRALTAHLVEDARALPPDQRAAVFADFDTFMRSGGGDDSNHCRRELHRALRDEPEWHRAYIYALALDKGADPRRVQAEAKTLLAGLEHRMRA